MVISTVWVIVLLDTSSSQPRPNVKVLTPGLLNLAFVVNVKSVEVLAAADEIVSTTGAPPFIWKNIATSVIATAEPFWNLTLTSCS